MVHATIYQSEHEKNGPSYLLSRSPFKSDEIPTTNPQLIINGTFVHIILQPTNTEVTVPYYDDADLLRLAELQVRRNDKTLIKYHTLRHL